MGRLNKRPEKRRPFAQSASAGQTAGRFLLGRIPTDRELAVTISDQAIRTLGVDPRKEPGQMMYDEFRLWERMAKPMLGPSPETKATVKSIVGKTMPEVRQAIEAELAAIQRIGPTLKACINNPKEYAEIGREYTPHVRRWAVMRGIVARLFMDAVFPEWPAGFKQAFAMSMPDRLDVFNPSHYRKHASVLSNALAEARRGVEKTGAKQPGFGNQGMAAQPAGRRKQRGLGRMQMPGGGSMAKRAENETISKKPGTRAERIAAYVPREKVSDDREQKPGAEEYRPLNGRPFDTVRSALEDIGRHDATTGKRVGEMLEQGLIGGKAVGKLATSGPLAQRIFVQVADSGIFQRRFGIGKTGQLVEAITFIGGKGRKEGDARRHLGNRFFDFLLSQGIITIHDYAVYLARPAGK